VPAAYPCTAEHPMTLASACPLGDVAVLRYLLGSRDRPPGLEPCLDAFAPVVGQVRASET
jgi:hypothetical protein